MRTGSNPPPSKPRPTPPPNPPPILRLKDKYHLFAWLAGTKAGGAGDYQCTGTLEECRHAWKSSVGGRHWIGHIANHNMQIVDRLEHIE